MGPFSSERQASQLKRREKVREIHILRSEGYKIGQIAENVGMSTKSISRMLSTDPESMCVDGLQYIGKSLEAYKEQIYELMERGFKNAQIQRKINSMFPEANIKISTLGDFCRTARAELLENTDKTNPAMTPAGNTPKLDGNSDLEIYADKINEMLSEDKETALIYAMIKADGYSGSYEVFAQYCLNMNPAALLSEKDERVCREMPGGKKDSKTVTRQSSQLKRYEKVREIHILRSEGYTSGQISQMKGISAKTVKRLLNMEI